MLASLQLTRRNNISVCANFYDPYRPQIAVQPVVLRRRGRIVDAKRTEETTMIAQTSPVERTRRYTK